MSNDPVEAESSLIITKNNWLEFVMKYPL